MKILGYVCCLFLLTSCLTERPGSRNFASEKPITSKSTSGINFGKTVYPITNKYCSSCHGSAAGEGPYQFPSNVDEQHLIVLNKQFVDLNKIEESKLVYKLRQESHNCWTNNCQDDALEMENAIRRWVPFIDKTLLAPPGVQTGEIGFLSGTDTTADVAGRTAKIITFDLSSDIGSPTTISVKVEMADEAIAGQRKVYIKEIILNPTNDDVVVQDVRVLVQGNAVAGNVFSFISDVISPTSPDNRKELSQGATAVIPIDEDIADPTIKLVIKQLRVY